MIGRIMVLSTFMILTGYGAGGGAGAVTQMEQVAQAPRLERQPVQRNMRERAVPKPNRRALQVSPLADLTAEMYDPEPRFTEFKTRSDSFVLKLVCFIRNVGNKPSAPTSARLRLEPIMQVTGERTLERPVPALKPGESKHLSLRIRLNAAELKIAPRLGLRFHWNCEADPLPHEKGKFRRNNNVRKYHTVRAGYAN